MNKDKNSERINEFYTNIKVLSLICLDKDNTENAIFLFFFLEISFYGININIYTI